MEALKRFYHEEDGQGLAEYALILGLIAIVVVAALTTMGGAINNSIGTTADQFPE
jgi:pilus assembly protein Flp/PilA